MKFDNILPAYLIFVRKSPLQFFFSIFMILFRINIQKTWEILSILSENVQKNSISKSLTQNIWKDMTATLETWMKNV